MVIGSPLLVACASVPQETAIMRSSGATGMTAPEIRLRLHDFMMKYPGMIEQTALRISRDSVVAGVTRNLLRWQLYGIPAYFRTLFHDDPYLSLVDTWILTLQAIKYYEEGPGKDDFGEHQAHVIETYREFDTELRGLVWAAAGADSVPPETEARVMEWVDGNPIESELLLRRSVLPLVAEVMAEGGQSLGDAVAGLEEGIQDIGTRMMILSDFTPKQVQWQVELATLDFLGSLDSDSGLEELLHLSGYIDEVDSMIVGNLTLAIDAIEGQRRAVLRSVAEERSAILAAIVSERKALLSAVTAERLAASESIERLTADGLSNVRETSQSTVDQLFHRALLLVAAIFGAAIFYRFISVRVIGQGVSLTRLK